MENIFQNTDIIEGSVFNYKADDFPQFSDDQIKNLKKIEVIFGDITKVSCDAIVNSANKELSGGPGVDEAIHKAAGPQLKEECEKLNGCLIGQAKITQGYNLPSRYVIHTVGPNYRREDRAAQTEQLRQCYYNCLKVAHENDIETITFPAISTGIYGFPTRLSLPVVFTEITKALTEFYKIKKVYLICYTPIQYRSYTAYFDEILKQVKKDKK